MLSDVPLITGVLERPDGVSIYWERYRKSGRRGRPLSAWWSGLGSRYRSRFAISLDSAGAGENLASLSGTTGQARLA
jgi:hypothetical protein